MLATLLLLFVIVAGGYLTNLPKESRYLLAKAVLLTGIGTVITLVCFMGIFAILAFTGGLSVLLDGVGALFLLILVVAIVDGFLLYWLGQLLSKWLKISTRVLTMAEYIIQWSLIYITVYQVLYDNLFPANGGELLQHITLSSPSDMMFAVLPSLISVWIAVIITKVKENSI